jgi:hypothetical protein
VAITCVLVVFIAPAVDLPDTTLGAKHNAQLVMLCITLLAVASFLVFALKLRWRKKIDIPIQAGESIHSRLCIFLC